MVYKRHAIKQGIKRIHDKYNVKLTEKQMKKIIRRTIKNGEEIHVPMIGIRHFQDKETGLICVLLRNHIVLTCMFPNENYKFPHRKVS